MTSIPDEFPWMATAERVYGPLADAFGLRPVRDAFDTWREIVAAQLGEAVANAQVLGVVAAGAFEGMSRLTQRLDRLRSEGETISSPTALLRLSLGEFDGAMHAAMLSEPGLAATAASVRATSRRRSGWQKLAALGATWNSRGCWLNLAAVGEGGASSFIICCGCCCGDPGG
jgi:hypothetical protein